MTDLKALAEVIIKGDQASAVNMTKEALDEGLAPKTILDDGLISGMDVVGARFKKNEVYIPEVLISARAMKMAMEVLEPELVKAGVEPPGGWHSETRREPKCLKRDATLKKALDSRVRGRDCYLPSRALPTTGLISTPAVGTPDIA